MLVTHSLSNKMTTIPYTKKLSETKYRELKVFFFRTACILINKLELKMFYADRRLSLILNAAD